MAEVGSYRKTPVLDLDDVTVLTGTTNVTSVDYDYGIMNSTNLRMYTAITMIDDIEELHSSSQYNTDLRIKVVVTYWNSDGSGADIIQTIVCYPYTSFETAKPVSAVDMDLEDYYVKNITITLEYSGDKNSVLFTTVLVKASATTNEVLSESYNTSVALDSVTTYSDGCKLFYTGDTANPLTLKFSADGDGNLAAIVVTNSAGTVVKTIPITRYTTPIV